MQHTKQIFYCWGQSFFYCWGQSSLRNEDIRAKINSADEAPGIILSRLLAIFNGLTQPVEKNRERVLGVNANQLPTPQAARSFSWLTFPRQPNRSNASLRLEPPLNAHVKPIQVPSLSWPSDIVNSDRGDASDQTSLASFPLFSDESTAIPPQLLHLL